MTLESQDIEAIARRVVQLVGRPGGLVDAKCVAAALQVERNWVYAHARELGAVRLGDGPRARLRSDLLEVRERVAALTAQADEPALDEPPRRRRRRPAESFGVKLIQGRSNR
jgi:hypothetical protein